MAGRPPLILFCWLCLLAPAFGEDFNAQFTDSQAIELLVSGVLNKELDLVTEQVDALRSISEQRKEKLLARFARPMGPDPGTAEPSRPLKYAELQSEANRQAFTAVEEVLLPHQLKRWKQIVLQLSFGSEPSKALLLQTVAQQLKIEQEQERAIKDAFTDAEKKIQAMAAEIRKERDEIIRMKVLTPKQYAEFENLFGPPFRRGNTKPQTGKQP
ncbi:MAG: hypothetical protein L0Y58_09980 [Verrucomicrobia subdivision 3 bacterium]|nr:hypothetical protein [Limisphaerales bacterium]